MYNIKKTLRNLEAVNPLFLYVPISHNTDRFANQVFILFLQGEEGQEDQNHL